MRKYQSSSSSPSSSSSLSPLSSLSSSSKSLSPSPLTPPLSSSSTSCLLRGAAALSAAASLLRLLLLLLTVSLLPFSLRWCVCLGVRQPQEEESAHRRGDLIVSSTCVEVSVSFLAPFFSPPLLSSSVFLPYLWFLLLFPPSSPSVSVGVATLLPSLSLSLALCVCVRHSRCICVSLILSPRNFFVSGLRACATISVAAWWAVQAAAAASHVGVLSQDGPAGDGLRHRRSGKGGRVLFVRRFVIDLWLVSWWCCRRRRRWRWWW
jgi:hypothetical protein